MQNAARAAGSSATHDHYLNNGYVVVPGAVPVHKIDRLNTLFQRDIADSSARFFRQNTNRYERNRKTDAGHIIQSFLDIHHYKRFPEFRQAALDVYFAPEMLATLREVTGYADHNLMQSMLFDANAATTPHQDWWYLDSVPNGHLLGAWIALEDIDERAGRFYVIPGSHNVRLDEPNMKHSDWLDRMRAFLADHPDKVSAPALKKGDVLFWNSRTIHGALPTQDLRFSRKSLTAHYMPSSMTFGNLFTAKPWIQYEQVGVHRYFANQPEHSLKAEVVSKVKQAVYDHPTLMRLARKMQRRSVADV